MKKYISLIIISFVLLSCANKTNIDQLTKRYPTADAVFVEQNRSYVLNEDGSVDYHYSHKLAYLTHYAFNSQYGETFILYNPEYQTLIVNKCETLTPDGRTVLAPENAFNELLPQNASDAPAYNHLLEMVVTHTALEVGAVVLLDYVIHSKPGYSAGLFGNQVLSCASPVQKMKFELSVPESTALNYATFNINAEPKTRTKDGKKKLSWIMEDISNNESETLFPESAMPRIVFSSEELIAVLIDINQDLTGELTQELTDWTSGLRNGNSTDVESVFAIQKNLVQNFNTYHLSFAQAAYRYRNSRDVFQSNGGTEIEKTQLFANILHGLGIEASVVATIPAWLQTESNVLNIDMVTAFYVRAKVAGKTFYLSAVYENKADPTQVFDGVLLVDGQSIEAMKVAEDRVKLEGKLLVSKDKMLSGEMSISLANGMIDAYSLLRDEGSLKKMVSVDIEQQKIETNMPNELSASFELNKSALKQIKDLYYELEIPFVHAGINQYKTVFNVSSRNTSIHFPTLIDEYYSFDIELDNDLELLLKPVEIIEKNAMAEMQISITQESKGANVQIEKSFKLLKQDVSPEEYSQIEKMFLTWCDATYQTLKLR